MTTGFSSTTTPAQFSTGDSPTYTTAESTAVFQVGSSSAGATTLDGLTDVDTSGVSDGDALVWDSGTSTWVADAVSGSLPSQTGNEGAVLGTDGDDAAWVRMFGDGLGTADVGVEDALAWVSSQTETGYGWVHASTVLTVPRAGMDAQEGMDGSSRASVMVTAAGDLQLAATGEFTINEVPVDVSGGTTNDVLTFDGTKIALAAPSGGDLDDLGDVDTSGVSDGDVLTYDSGDWIAQAPTGGGGGSSVGGDLYLSTIYT